MIKHLFVMDPLERVNPDADTTFAFLLAGQERGDVSLSCSIGDLFSDGSRGGAWARPTTVSIPTTPGGQHCAFGEPERIWFDDIDVVWMRKDPPVDDAFMLATMILDRRDPKRTVMMNRPEGLRVANEKLWALFAADLGPETVVSSKISVLASAIQRFGKGVLKPIGRAGGAGVMIFDKADKNLFAAAEVLTEYERVPAVAQRYLPDAQKGDKRVILLGGEPIAGLWRIPQGQDHRANMHVGGTVEAAAVDDADRAIAARLKPGLLELGQHFVGIDVIGGRLTEVNVTSPTGIQEIDRLEGRTGDARLALMVLRYVDGLLAERS